jgi:hypothetical protein
MPLGRGACLDCQGTFTRRPFISGQDVPQASSMEPPPFYHFQPHRGTGSWPGKDKHSKSKHTAFKTKKFLCKGIPSRQLSKDKPKKVLPPEQRHAFKTIEQGHAFKTIEQGQTFTSTHLSKSPTHLRKDKLISVANCKCLSKDKLISV